MDLKLFDKHYWNLISTFGFKHKKLKSSRGAYIEYSQQLNDVVFNHTVFVHQYNTTTFYLQAESDEITKRYNMLEGVNKKSSFNLFSCNLANYLDPVNKDGYFNRGITDIEFNAPFSDNESDAQQFAELIYRNVFLKSVPAIMEESDSLEKIDKLLNQYPPALDRDGDPKIKIHSTSLPDQLLAGTLVSHYLNNPSFKELVSIYMRFGNKYEAGEIEEMDIIKNNFG
jgi:hypothetical protein